MSLPWLTREVPGCGGAFVPSKDTFEVEEIPAYEPCGDGEHLFLWVEKEGRSTPEVAEALAAHLGAQARDVSWAGLKDRHARTRQLLCVPARVAGDRWQAFSTPGVRVLWARRHTNKLKTGHLKGNRFTVRLAGVTDRGALEAAAWLLSGAGVPNFYGAQRFGLADDNAARGKALLKAGGRMKDRFRRKLYLSAYQSSLFNRVLARRLEDGLFLTVLEGDVLEKHATGGSFVSEASAVDQPRLEAFELSPTGPMFGPRMRMPHGAAWERERSVLEEEGLVLEDFAAGGDETQGTRRLLRVPVAIAVSEPEATMTRLDFELPAGSYATVVVGELIKA